MKITEIITEDLDGVTGKPGMHHHHAAAIPGAEIWPELDNSSGYKAYRFSLGLGGMPDHPMDTKGPTGLKMVTIAYTPEEADMLSAAAKHFKTKGYELSPKGSSEPDDTHRESPYHRPGPIKLIRK